MNTHILSLKTYVSTMLFLWSIFCNISISFAQVPEVEPNNLCQEAQDLGTVSLPFIVDGSLFTTNVDAPDFDYYKVTGTPGSSVSAELVGVPSEGGALLSPQLWLLDTSCNFLKGASFPARLSATFPEDGNIILLASSNTCCDLSAINGTYQITIDKFHSIGSISGRVVDAVTRSPLSGDVDPFALVILQSCDNAGNCSVVNSQFADNVGGFQFVSDSSGQRLEVGTYQIIASARNYQPNLTQLFAVAEDENKDIGDLKLQPFPIIVSNIKSCSNLPSTGGTCRYSAQLNSRSPNVITGVAWSTVDGIGIGGSFNPTAAIGTRFQTALPTPVTLPPGTSRVVNFEFQVPSTVRDRAQICPTLMVSQARPQPFFDIVFRNLRLFCIRKLASEPFAVIPDREVQKKFGKLDAQMLLPPN